MWRAPAAAAPLCLSIDAPAGRPEAVRAHLREVANPEAVTRKVKALARARARRGGIGPYPVVSPRIPYISLYPVVSRTGYRVIFRPG